MALFESSEIAGQRPIKVMVAAATDELLQGLDAFVSSKREMVWSGAVSRVRECLERLDDWEPDVLLLEEGMGGGSSVEIARSVKQKRPRTAVFVMVRGINYSNADYHRRLMTANASGVFQLVEPLSFQDWIQPMRDAVELLSKIPEKEGAEFGKVIAVHSLKGGVGRTLLAANLAVALTRRQQQTKEAERKVLLVDLNWPYGGIDTFLNLNPTRSSLDLLPVMNSLNRQNIYSATTIYMRPTLRVLAPPLHSEQADYLRDLLEEELFYAEYDGMTDDLLHQVQIANLRLGDQPDDSLRRELLEHVLRKAKAKQAVVQLLRRLLDSAPRYFDYIILDVPSVLDDLSLSALRNADLQLLIATPDVPAIRALRTELDLLANFGFIPERIRLLLNRVRKSSEISPSEIKELFAEWNWLPDLPEDPKLESLVNASELAVELPRPTPFATAVYDLAQAILSASPLIAQTRSQEPSYES